MRRPLVCLCALVALPLLCPIMPAAPAPDLPSPAVGNVSWATPSPTSAGSLPLGNGDLAANIWIEPSGDIVFYLSKSDAWDHLSRLIKLGRLRVKLTPALPTSAAAHFETTLDLATASVRITATDGQRHLSLRLWADAHHPRFVVEIDSSQPVTVTASLDPWRTAPRELLGGERVSAYGFAESPAPLIADADTAVDAPEAGVLWYHRNESSIWPATLDHQGLGDFKAHARDPLLHRTFGGLLSGEDFQRSTPRTLRSSARVKHAALAIDVLTAQTPDAASWRAALRAQAAAARTTALADAWRAHTDDWREFWSRSHVVVTARHPAPASEAAAVSAAYVRQRYLIACAGRGAYPIKFNGSLFTADWNLPDAPFDADYRRWGGAYWFQNTRLPYWTLPAAGDTDFLRPLVKMYLDALPLAEFRTRRWFDHDGAFFPETLYFWGSHLNDNYGWQRPPDLPVGQLTNRYIGRHYNGGLELLALLLATYAHTGDATLLHDSILPLARPVLEFFAAHYPRDAEGHLHLAPAQALETWWDCENPTPDIAGLRSVLDDLLALPAPSIDAADRRAWSALLAAVPPLPIGLADGRPHILPAAVHEAVPRNSENAELYPVFPFHLYGIGRPALATARETFARRTVADTGGWRQDAIQAALLGLTDIATVDVIKNATQTSAARFPGFFGPNFDWLPDMDHGSVTELALQTMLLQCVADKIYLFPAWPADRWNVRFRLHANRNTIVDGELKDGQLIRLDVTPAARRADVVVLLGADKTRLPLR